LCQAEIGYYRRSDQAGAICLVDVSKTDEITRDGVTQADVLLIVKRGAILIASLFALFCASLEVERVGIAFSKQQ
jgi:hypothetical protein